ALGSGHADVFFPLVLAGETAYLGFLGTHPRFQKSVDAQEAKAQRQDGSAAALETARRMLKELPRPLVQRFGAVRTRCAELRQLARQMRDPAQARRPQPGTAMKMASLAGLLWMYRRLLFTQYSFSQFLKKTSVEQIESDIREFESRLKAFWEAPADPRQQRLRKVVEDSLQTS